MARIFLEIAGWLALFYLLIFIPSFVIEKSRLLLSPPFVYIAEDAPRSLYTSGPQHAAYGVAKLDHYPDQIFIVGGSTAADAFTPREIMKEIPGYKVHNLAIVGANITEIKQIIDIIDARAAVGNLHSAVFVLCGQFATFLDNKREFRDDYTTIDRERMRHHLYKPVQGQAAPVFGEPAMAMAVFLVRPFIWLYTLKFNVTNELAGLRERLAILSQRQAEKEPSGKQISYKDYWLRLFENRGLTDDQFNQFKGLVDKLTALKATVVYVDLPVPGYFRKDFFIYDDYRRRVKAIAGNPAVHYLDLSAWAPDTDFSDDVHPRRESSGLWGAALARYLKTIVRPPLEKPAKN